MADPEWEVAVHPSLTAVQLPAGPAIEGLEDAPPAVQRARDLTLLELFDSDLMLRCSLLDGSPFLVTGAFARVEGSTMAFNALELAEFLRLHAAGLRGDGVQPVLVVKQLFGGGVCVSDDAVVDVLGEPGMTRDEVRRQAAGWDGEVRRTYLELRGLAIAATRRKEGELGDRARLSIACWAADRATQQAALPW